jgi:hypothetical protein
MRASGPTDPRATGSPRSDLRDLGADDGIRTRDPHLGKVVLYQLSHVRVVGAMLTPALSSFNRRPGASGPSR